MGLQHPFPINLLFPLPLVNELEERLKYLRALNKIGFEKKSKPIELTWNLQSFLNLPNS